MILCFDIGGTKTRIAGSPDGVNLIEPKIFLTPKNYDDAIRLFKEVADQIVGTSGIATAAVVGVAGSLDKTHEKLNIAPHLNGWENRSLKKDIQSVVNARVYVLNDAALAGLAEAISGAGKDSKIVAYITIGTGVGGVRIVDQKIDNSVWGFEPGHQVIDVPANGSTQVNGQMYGYLDDLIGGSGLEWRFGKNPKMLEDPKVWEGVSKLLAIGLNNVIVFWSPDTVVLGGGVVESKKISLESTSRYLRQVMKIFPTLPDLREASIGEYATMHGGLYYLKNLNIQII